MRGEVIPSDKSGSDASVKLKSVGIEGPKMSVSRMPVLWPWRAKARARFAGCISLLSRNGMMRRSSGVYMGR